MRYLKYAAIVLLVAAVVAAVVAYQRRDSIARDIANAILKDTGATVTHISVESLKPERIRFSRIDLELASGSRIAIRGVAFPLSFPSVRPEHVSIDRVIVSLAEDDRTPPAPYSPMLKTIVELPQSVPSTAVTVAELTLPNTPAITDLVWVSAAGFQRLSLSAVSVDAAMELSRIDERRHRAALEAVVSDAGEALSVEFDLADEDDRFAIGGSVTFATAPWLPLLRELDTVPAGLETLVAKLAGPLEIALDDPGEGQLTVSATLSAADAVGASYAFEDGTTIGVRIPSTAPVAVVFRYPQPSWVASVEHSEVFVDAYGVAGLPLAISNLECRTGIHCDLDLDADAHAMEAPQVGVDGATLSASLNVTVDEQTIVEVAPGASVVVTELETEALSVQSVSATGASGARVTVTEDAWRLDYERVELAVRGFTDRKGMHASLPATLTGLSISNDKTMRTRIKATAGAGRLRLHELAMASPGIDGRLSLDGDRLRVTIGVEDPAMSARIEAGYELASETGRVNVRDFTLFFDRRKLSERLADWPYDWDLVAGTSTANVEVALSRGDESLDVAGSIDYRAENLAGRYEDIVFAGLDATITGRFDATPSLALSPSRVNLELLEVGTPIEHIVAEFSLDPTRTLIVDELSSSALGGRIIAEPFTFNAAAALNEIVLHLESVQLQFMADLIGSDGIEVSGSLSGRIPVSVQGKTVRIAGGRLENDPPGGTIRYGGGALLDAAATGSSLNVVSRALANFEFDSLSSDVDYSESGDLILGMRLSGINPDVDPRQPVILNLKVENNIPQLLKSLQAIRTIEEVFERRAEE